MTCFTVTTQQENAELLSWLDLSEPEQIEMDHVEYDDQTSTRFFRHQGVLYDTADFMVDDRVPEWHAGYPLNAFAMLMIRLSGDGESVDIGLMH